MNPLDHASPDAFIHSWAPPTGAVRSLGSHICLARPHMTRVPDTAHSPSNLVCSGRVRTHLPTPHSGSCPLDYTPLFVTLHRRQKEKLMQAHANRPIPLLSRNHHHHHGVPPLPSAAESRQPVQWAPNVVETGRRAVPPASQNVGAAHAARVSTPAQPPSVPESLTEVERAVPASVAAVMAHMTIASPTAATASAAAATRVGFSSPHHHHHHHHHHPQHQRPSAETRAPSTQQSPVMPPQHHHHHYQQQQRQPSTEVAPPETTATQQPQAQHMRYRVGRSGSTQLQPLPVTNGEATGVGAAGMVAAAAAAAAVSRPSVSHHRRSTSPLSSLPSSAGASMPREASATPLSLALSSIRRSTTRLSVGRGGGGGAAAAALTHVPRTAAAHHRLPHRSTSHENNNSTNSESRRDGGGAVAVAEEEETAMTPDVLADTRMFLRPPQHALRHGTDYTTANALGAESVDDGLATGSTLYRSAAAAGGRRQDSVEGAGAASAEQQRELQLHLQRALRRQRRLERLMFHDGDEEASLGGVDEEDGEEEDVLEGSSGSGRWEEGGDEEGDDALDPLWRTSSHIHSVLSPHGDAAALPSLPPPPPSVLSHQPRYAAPAPATDRLASVHPHEHVSLHRFHDPAEETPGNATLSIRADSVRGGRRGWPLVVGRGRSSTTSPSPQPDQAWARGRAAQQQQPSGSAATAEGSPVPVPASTHHRTITAVPSSVETATNPATNATTATRSAAMALSSADRRGTSEMTATQTPPAAAPLPLLLLRGASSMSFVSPSLPRQRGNAQERGSVRGGGRGEAGSSSSSGEGGSSNQSPPLPSPIYAGLAPRPSMPNAALLDVVAGLAPWEGVVEKSHGVRRAHSQCSGSDDKDGDVASLAETRAVVRVSRNNAESQRPSHHTLQSAVTAERGVGDDAAWLGSANGVSQEGGDAEDWAMMASSPSPSPSNHSHSPSPAARRIASRDVEPSLDAAEAVDDAAAAEAGEEEEYDIPKVRRTSPGVSEAASSKCTRFTATDDRSRSGDSCLADGEADSGDAQPRSAATSSSPSPPRSTPDARALVMAAPADVVDTRATTTTAAAAAALPPMVYLADMLRLSFSPGRDDIDGNESSSQSEQRAHEGASTPRDARGAAQERYPCHVSLGSESRGTDGTASISSSPPSPNRTAMRHVVDDVTDEDDDESVKNNGSGQRSATNVSPLRRCTPLAPSALTMTPTMPLSASSTAVAGRLALSADEHRLHASTASTVAGGDGAALAPLRFSEASTLSHTTDARWASSVASTPASAPPVFSTPAQTRLQSLLQASAWTAASRSACNNDDEDVDALHLRTPPRRGGGFPSEMHACRGGSGSGSLSRSPATPHDCMMRSGSLACEPGSPDAFMASNGAGMRAPASFIAVPHTPTTAPPTTTNTTTTAMPPPPFSPFRGSGSFLRVPPCWNGSTMPNENDGRPSDSFEADIQLLARMTRMTTGGGQAPVATSAFLSPPRTSHVQQPPQQQQRNSPLSSSPRRVSTNSLAFFVAAATSQDSTDESDALRSGSGVYGSAVAGRRSWAPQKARPQRRGRRQQQQRHPRPSQSGCDPYHALRLTPDHTSPSPSARLSLGECSSRSCSGVLVAPHRLTFGSAFASQATHVTGTATGGASDSGERWSTALSTPTATTLLHHPRQRQQQREPRASLPSYDEALRAQSGEAVSSDVWEDGPRSPSLASTPAAWMLSPSAARRTPSGRPSLSSTEFLMAPRRGQQQQRGENGARHSSGRTPSANTLPSYPSILSEAERTDRPPSQRRSLSTSGGSSEDPSHSHHHHRHRVARDGAPRRGQRAASLSVLRSPSAVGTRLTWGTAVTTSSCAAEASASDIFACASLSPMHSPRHRSPSGNSGLLHSGSTTPLRVPWSRWSGRMGMDRLVAVPAPPSAQPPPPQPSLADELRSFSSPLFASSPLPPSSRLPAVAAVHAPPVSAAPAAASTTFLASPARRSAGVSTGAMSLPPELQALLTRGAVGRGGASSPHKTPPQQRQRGCSERPEVNVDPHAASPSGSP